MITDYIVEFTSYLNAHNDGFSITSEKINRFFEMMADEDLDFTNSDDVLGVMKSIFCTNYQQYMLIEDYFKTYFHNKTHFKSISLLIKQKQHWQEQHDFFYKTYNSELESMNHLRELMEYEIDAIEKEVYENQNKYIDFQMPSKKAIHLTKKEESLINDIIDNNQSYGIPLSTSEKNIMNDIFKKHSESALYACDEFLFNNMKNYFIKTSEYALIHDDLEMFEKMHKLFNIMDKMSKQVSLQKLQENKYNENIKNFLNYIIQKKQNEVRLSYQQQIKSCHNQLQKLEMQHKLIQNKLKDINTQIDNKQHMIIEKDQSLYHRDEFIGKNAVKAYENTIDEYMQEVLDKKFNILSQREKDDIYYFIKKNIMSFKTRLSRQIHTTEINKIDIQTTLQNTMKTGGLPLKLSYQKPKANKTNIILILDVSGSCKEASQMMLTFMYILKSIFPRGCQTFAFVDSLYDISTVMDSSDINTSIEKTLALIPRRGVYSNYFIPFNSIWNEHRQIFTSDSIVVVIGDARNNHNPTGEEIIKNISRRVKKAYWLNTESIKKWNKDDSIAALYGKYFKMSEMLNTNDLIQFIQNLM